MFGVEMQEQVKDRLERGLDILFTHVFVDPQTRRPVPLGEEVKFAMHALTLDT